MLPGLKMIHPKNRHMLLKNFNPGLILASVFCLSLFSPDLNAQDDPAKASSKWKYKIEPNMMFPEMNGKTGISSLPLLDVDVSTSAIFERLKFGAMLYMEASNGNWSINSDFLYMHLEQNVKTGALINGGTVNMKQLGWELAALKKVVPGIEFGLGALLNSLDAEGNIGVKQPGGGTETKTGSDNKTWVDPMMIMRLSTNPKYKFYGIFRGEMGGFTIGSKMAWQVQGIAGYRFSKLFDASIGYRSIIIDYEEGGTNGFIYNMTTSGAMVRFGFSF